MENLRKYDDVGGGPLGGRALQVVKVNEDVSFDVREGETLAIVGECGCGKSTFAKVLMGFEHASSGHVMLHDRETRDTPVRMRDPRTVAAVQMVFQNPFDTLNPSETVGPQITRALKMFPIGTSDADRRGRIVKLLDQVKLPRAFADWMPRQSLGGQKHKVGIARAIAGNAKVVIADESVSALDGSVLSRHHGPAHGDPAQPTDHPSVHRPRLIGRTLLKRPGPRGASWSCRRDRHDRRRLRAAIPSPHGSPLVGGAGRGPYHPEDLPRPRA